MKVIHAHCAGLDVHKDTVVACMRRDNLGGSPDNQDEVTPGPAGGRA